MASAGLKVVLLYAVLQVICAENTRHHFLSGKFSPPVNYTSKLFLNAPSKSFENNLDHFARNGTTFKQRYWSYDRHSRQGGPIFLEIGGEWELAPYFIMDESSPINIYAKETGAYLFCLEHRFYGQSVPRGGASMWRYLNAAQAIEDIATFIDSMKKSFRAFQNRKWVLFGSSYAGNLAVWTRAKHPNLVHAVMASSAPVEARMNFPEYQEMVKKAIESVSHQCAQSVAHGFATIVELLKTHEGRETVKRAFNAHDVLSQPTDTDFLSTLIRAYGAIVLTPAGDDLKIRHDICAYHATNDTPVEKMRKLHGNFIRTYGNEHHGPQINKQLTHEQQAWDWQECTEFGYFQTTNSHVAGEFFGGTGNIPLSLYVNNCLALSPTLTEQAIRQRVMATNNKFGGKRTRATNLILPYGTNDPWRPLQITEPSTGIFPIKIQGASHCSDMQAVTRFDSQVLHDARQQILRQLKNILQH